MPPCLSIANPYESDVPPARALFMNMRLTQTGCVKYRTVSKRMQDLFQNMETEPKTDTNIYFRDIEIASKKEAEIRFRNIETMSGTDTGFVSVIWDPASGAESEIRFKIQKQNRAKTVFSFWGYKNRDRE